MVIGSVSTWQMWLHTLSARFLVWTVVPGPQTGRLGSNSNAFCVSSRVHISGMSL